MQSIQVFYKRKHASTQIRNENGRSLKAESTDNTLEISPKCLVLNNQFTIMEGQETSETDLLKSGPHTLEKLCNRKILDNILLSCGRKIEDRARLILEASTSCTSTTSGLHGRTVASNSLIDSSDGFDHSIRPRKRRSSTTILTGQTSIFSINHHIDKCFYRIGTILRNKIKALLEEGV